MSFPSRVNLVFHQRWVLAKKKHGNCLAELVHVSEVQKQHRFRKVGDYRWLIQSDARLDGFLIRNDHHPRRALVGGIPLRLEGANKSDANQRWVLCFPNDSPGIHKPFLIRSVQSGMYLVVEEAHQCVILQKDAPQQFWQIHDATRRADAFIPTERAQPSPVADEPEPDELLAPYDGDVCGAFGDDLSTRRSSQLSGGSLGGPLPKNMSMSQGTFTSVEVLFDQMVLSTGLELLPPGSGASPQQVLGRLWGNNSTFLYRYQARRNGRDVQWSGLNISEEMPWLATAQLTCSVHVPVLGWRPYEEVLRITLCYEPMVGVSNGDQGEVLAVQQVGHTDGGRFGVFRNENLLLFYQSEGATLLTAFALTPKGAFSGMAVEGQKKAFADFLHSFQDEAKTWRPSTKIKGQAPPSTSLADPRGETETCCTAAARKFHPCGVQ